MFSCTFCGKTVQSSGTLSCHVLSHTKEKPHKCLICKATFGTQSSLKKHVKTVHDGVKAIKTRNTQCPLCSYTCFDKSMLQNHLRKHSSELPFFCDVTSCGFKTKHKVCLERHVRAIHRNERPHQCPSDGCNYKAKFMACLNRHLKVHSNEKPFACKVSACNYSCKSKKELKMHTSTAHSDKKPFKCSSCDFHGKVKRAVTVHQLTHMKTKSFKCQAPNCNFSTNWKYTVMRHYDAKHRKRNIRCTQPGCYYWNSSKTLLKRHLKKHELPKLKCPVDSCSYSTKIKTNLADHISRLHEDIRTATAMQPRRFEPEIAGTARAIETLHCCFPDCKYQTKVPHQFDHHRITHNQEERYQHVCSFCFSRFSKASQLNAHVQRHTREKPYYCPYCKYSTFDVFRLRNHGSRFHHIYVIPRGKEDGMRKCLTCGRNCFSYSEFVLHSVTHLQAVVVLERFKVQTL